MKRSILAATILAALASSATAADVTVYGRVDLGVSYQNSSVKFEGNELTKTDSFTMDSGNSTASRFGIKGSEDLGNGVQVGFILENGFTADDGALKTSGSIFDRQSTLFIKGSAGTLYAGRMGSLISDAGSVGFYAGTVSPFGSGWGSISGHTGLFANYTTRYNNTLAYVSPTVHGTTLYAQYAMGDKDENNSTNDRYYALGAKYAVGNLELAALVDYANKQSVFDDSTIDPDDGLTFNVGGSYNFGLLKAFAAAQYFSNVSDAASIGKTTIKELGKLSGADLPSGMSSALSMDGWGVNIGLTAPVFGGTALLSAGYMDGDAEIHTGDPDDEALNNVFDNDIKAWALSAGYTYDLSKRTSLYAGAGYTYKELKTSIVGTGFKGKSQTYQLMTGLVHKF